MKNFSFKFLTLSTLFLASISLLPFLFNFSQFYIPNVAFFTTLLAFESKIKKQIFLSLVFVILFLQFSDLPLIFIFVLYLQYAIVSLKMFKITTFDLPIVVFLIIFTLHLIAIVDESILLYIFSGSFHLKIGIFKIISGFVITLIIFIYFKTSIRELFKKDSWT